MLSSVNNSVLLFEVNSCQSSLCLNFSSRLFVKILVQRFQNHDITLHVLKPLALFFGSSVKCVDACRVERIALT